MDLENVKSKLKKLFAVAENDASADGEIANAMSAAMGLMAAYHLTREDIVEDSQGQVDLNNINYVRKTLYSKYSALTGWESQLCTFVRDFVGTVGVYVTPKVARRNKHGMATGGTVTAINYYGPEKDVQFAIEVFDELVHFISAAATLRYGSALSRGKAAAYAEGFVRGLKDAQEEGQLRLTANNTDCRALAVVNQSLTVQKAAKKWLTETLNVRTYKGSKKRSQADKNQAGYNQGRNDGKNYTVGARPRAGYLT